MPDSPTNIITTNFNDEVIITWDEAISNGLPITAYSIHIQMSTFAFTQELMYCNGGLAQTVSTRTCQLPLSVLESSPFNLIEGDHVYVKIIASNVYGDSWYSTVGNGASIWVVPDAPLFLTNNVEITNAYEIGLLWQEGINNGGTEVLDFRIWYTLESDDLYEILVSSLLVEYYTTIDVLVPGENYKFKV